MALSVAVFVGDSKNWMADLIERSKKLVVGPGNKDKVDIAPLCYRDL